MELDVADLSAIQAQGQLNDVILHEMAHVLGFGTMWDFDPRPFEIIPIGPDNPPNTLLVGRGGANPVFTGASTRGAFFGAISGAGTFSGIPVPVENSFGIGTRDSHWREPILNPELMTGHISSPGVQNPLSAITISTFRDLGYVVNDAVADPFTFLPSLLAASGVSSLGEGIQLNEAPLTVPIIVIDRRGGPLRGCPGAEVAGSADVPKSKTPRPWSGRFVVMPTSYRASTSSVNTTGATCSSGGAGGGGSKPAGG
jgi:hypothetical protein